MTTRYAASTARSSCTASRLRPLRQGTSAGPLDGLSRLGDQGSGAPEVAEVGGVARDNRPALDNRTVAAQLNTRIVQRFRYPNLVGEDLVRIGLRRLVQGNRDVAGGQVAAIVRLELRHCPLAHECGSFHGPAPRHPSQATFRGSHASRTCFAPG